MKKIGILTFTQPQNMNYGAVLQAYALSQTVQLMGYDVELIDIRDTPNKKPFSTSFKNKIRSSIEGNPFRTFLKSQISLSKPLHSFVELQEQAREYDAVIVGSDQVWRPEYCGDLALHYFLDFVPEGVDRIAYAASFGVDRWVVDQGTTEKVRNEAAKFKAVSVRELAGVGLCQEIFEIKASHVLDPTILADKNLFYDLLPLPKIEHQYIASFILDRTKETEVIESYISKKTGKPIHLLNKREINLLGRKWNKYLTIKDWLRKFRDSDRVITDSFHGVCFCLIFQKQFICIGNKSRGLSRFKSLLNIVGLEDRIFLNHEQLISSKAWDSEINYSKVNDRIKNQQQFSFEFLKNALAE